MASNWVVNLHGTTHAGSAVTSIDVQAAGIVPTLSEIREAYGVSDEREVVEVIEMHNDTPETI